MIHLLILAVGLMAGPSRAAEWRDASLPTSFKRLSSISMLSRTEGWAGGRDGLLLRWDGASWRREDAGIAGDIVSIQFASARTGWAATYDVGTQRSLLYRYDGTSWDPIELPTPVRVTTMSVMPDGAVWLFGQGGRILRFDGDWREFHSPGYRTPLAAARGRAGSMWVVGEFGTVWRWDGSVWSALTPPVDSHLNGVTVDSDGTVWVVGDGGLILRRSGNTWQRIEHSDSAHLYGVAVRSPNDVWFCGSDALLHWDGATVTPSVPSVHGVLTEMQILNDGAGWAVGFGAVLQRAPETETVRKPRLGFYRQELLPNVLGVQGVAFGDVNADGADDLYIVSARDANHLLLNDGTGQFVDVTGYAGVMGHVATAPLLQQMAQYSATWGDFNNDGALDLVLGGWHGATDLFRQGNALNFENVGNRLPLDEGPLSVNSVVLADVDRDGWLDMFATNEHGSDRLWLNDRRGGWKDGTARWGLVSQGGSRQAAFGDLDNDGDADLYVCTWRSRNAVYRNDGGSFANLTQECAAAGDTSQSNGVTLADLDNDGDLDIVTTRASGRNNVYRNDGDWQFTDVSGIVSFASAPNSYGSAASDFDQDGDLDLAIVSAEGINYFENVGGLTFVSTVVDGLTDIRDARAAAVSDIDGDGDMDMFVGSSADLVDRVADFGRRRSSCFVNKLDRGNAVTVRLAGTRSNTMGVGGRVYLYRVAEDAGRQLVGMREVSAGGGYLSQNTAASHFGADTAATYVVEAVFPSGRHVTVEDVRSGARLIVREQHGPTAWANAASRSVWNWFWSDLVQVHLWPLILIIPLLVWGVRTVSQRFAWKPMLTALYTIAVSTVYALLLAGTASTPGWLARITPPVVVFAAVFATLGISYWSRTVPSRRVVRRRQLEALSQRADLSSVLSSALSARTIAERTLGELKDLFPTGYAAIILRAADSDTVELVVPEGGAECAVEAGMQIPKRLTDGVTTEFIWSDPSLSAGAKPGMVGLCIPLNAGTRVIGAVCGSVAEEDVERVKESEVSLRGFLSLLATSLYNAQLQEQARRYDAAYRQWLDGQARMRTPNPTAQSAHRELVALLGASKRRHPAPLGSIESLVGTSTRMEDVVDRVRQVAASDTTVLLTGESGTGKELAARAIHGASPRAHGPFVAVNCGAIPEGLLESELFGHVKGAFTGAQADRPGVFQRANGGTIFLDEIAEMNPSAQVRLLRVLQERSVQPVGGEQEIGVDVRVIAATHRNLHAAVESNEFRSDLFYRLNVFPIGMPALRDRLDDLPELTAAILQRLAERLGHGTTGMSEDALEQMLAYDWPGNVRELENVLERALILSDGDLIREEHLQFSRSSGERRAESNGEAGSLVGRTLASLEKELIEQTLSACDGNVSETARQLGVTRDILRYRIKKYDIGQDT